MKSGAAELKEGSSTPVTSAQPRQRREPPSFAWRGSRRRLYPYGPWPRA